LIPGDSIVLLFARRKRADFIGLELGPEVMRLLQLELHAQRWLIKNYATAPLQPRLLLTVIFSKLICLENSVRELVVATNTAGCAAAGGVAANAVISSKLHCQRIYPRWNMKLRSA